MSYDSWDGGTHSRHDWVPIGHEVVAQWDERGAGPIPGTKSIRLPMRLPDKLFVVRACRLCREVWWQEYNPAAAREAPA